MKCVTEFILASTYLSKHHSSQVLACLFDCEEVCSSYRDIVHGMCHSPSFQVIDIAGEGLPEA